MSGFTTPTQTEQLSTNGQPTNPQPQFITRNWYIFLCNMRDWIIQNSQSGTTANRPTKGLYVGRRYFDTSLGAKGKPIWVGNDGVTWILADGTAA